jgi:magnesium transporter
MESAAQADPIVDCAAYAGGTRASALSVDQIQAALACEGQFVWIGLYEPDQALLRTVQQQFGLHDLAIEDAINAHQRPKLEVYEDSVFIVLHTAQRVPATGRLEFGETHVFLGRNYIITVRHGSLRSHVGVRQRCEATPHLLSQGAGYVLYSLMDFIVDQYLPIVRQIEDEVQNLESVVLDDPTATDATAKIYLLKRDLVSLRRAVSPLADVCNRLLRFDIPHIPADTRPYFRDVYDHIIRLNESIDAQRELLTSALEAHLSLMTVAQNEHMKRITAWAAMIAVPTMIAGIYGMNFEGMPELHWTYGYYISLVVMVLSCLGLYIGFKRSRWL